ncbi:hypothetical protein HDU96_000786 [Phlyctochytrium bullatum]|nr:hypothetical protein HDU96_000786 [Phlyctochytrium bullatum]
MELSSAQIKGSVESSLKGTTLGTSSSRFETVRTVEKTSRALMDMHVDVNFTEDDNTTKEKELGDPDTEVTTVSISCLGLLVDEVDLMGEASDFDLELYPHVADPVFGAPNRANQLMGGAGGVLGPSLSLSSVPGDAGTYGYQSSVVESLSVYPELRRLLGTGVILTGQKALQKRIRKILRKLANGGSDKGDWQNYTLVCLQMSTMFEAQQDQQEGGTDGGLGGAEWDVVHGAAGAKPVQVMERFITELINLLVCDNVVVREAVKEFLGNEPNERLFGKLASYLVFSLHC